MTWYEDVILAAVRSFRIGAPICIEDVRLAAWADGHSLAGIGSQEIAEVLRACCEPVQGPYGHHDRVSWVRRI